MSKSRSNGRKKAASQARRAKRRSPNKTRPSKPSRKPIRSQGVPEMASVQTLPEFLDSVPGGMSQQERAFIIDQALLMIDQVYVHLPLKRAMHAIEPVQRLRLLKQRLDNYSERQFHNEMISIFTHLRDLHTNYILPEPYRSRVAFLPFRIEVCFEKPSLNAAPDEVAAKSYVVTEATDDALAAGLKRGATVEYWNGVPIDLAVERNAEREAGSNPDARLAQGLESMTNRWMGMSLPPDEHWVTLGYRSDDPADQALHEVRLQWQVFVPPPAPGGGGGAVPGAERASAVIPYRRRLGIDAKAEMQRRVRKMLFDPKEVQVEHQMAKLGNQRTHACLTFHAALARSGAAEMLAENRFPRTLGRSAGARRNMADKSQAAPGSAEQAADLVAGLKLQGVDLSKQSVMPDVIPFFGTVPHPAGPFAYIRIATFAVANVDEFIQEFIRIISLLPQGGLIVDVRGNGGGVIAAGEGLLQTMTPATIVPERFCLINTPLTLKLCENDGELAPWHASVEQAIETASAFSAGIPLTPPEFCNSIGQVYQGPVVLITDAKCYSTTDIFASGFQDHGIGVVLGTEGHTGAGGANVWEHTDLQAALPEMFKPLPGGTSFRVALRRSTRVGKHGGEVLEDLGVAADPPIYRMTRRDILEGNPDLMAHAGDILAKMPRQRLIVSVKSDKLIVTTSNLTRIDLFINQRPIESFNVKDGTSTFTLPAGGVGSQSSRRIEARGFRGELCVASVRIGNRSDSAFIHARDPLMSIWQSATDAIAAKSAKARRAKKESGRGTSADPLVSGTNSLIAAMNIRAEQNARKVRAASAAIAVAPRIAGESPNSNIDSQTAAKANAKLLDELADSLTASDIVAALAPRGVPASADVARVLGTAASCAKISFQIAQAEFSGDPVRAAALKLNFEKGGCDPRWAECITEYLIHAKIHGQASIPYIPYRDINDFVLNDVLDKNTTIAIIGDWGTGSDRAIQVLDAIAAHKPDVLIHLGDIYYAGTEREAEIFFNLVTKHLPGVRIFTLAGNHDMYAGGQAYYDLLRKLNQPASFFCLRNADWQLLAMDTGYNDFNPNTVDTNVTRLQDRECEWHLDKMNNNGGRRSVLMSHHQLFSGTGIGGGAINTELDRQLYSVIENLSLWMWGHEHSHLIFDEYNRLKRGRCIGASAIPVPTGDADADPYRIVTGLPGLRLLPPRVGPDPSGLWYDCAYAILQLKGADGTLSHYQASMSDPFYVEKIT